ncbi:MAG: hypothetical protein COA67_07945 [Lutibacter sp.]|nr:MAG: hypothetical protein COA67_07945 [Lutibacter sp.]
MKSNSTILTVLTYFIIISTSSILLNDIREFDFENFKNFISWSKTADKSENWFTSKSAIEWSYYVISVGLFFWRAYLIYAFTYFISILNEVEKGNYFSDKNSTYFKKIGNIFIYYTINVVILRFLLASIKKSDFNFLNEFKDEFTYLIPCGLALYILSEIFKKGNQLKKENELTI